MCNIEHYELVSYKFLCQKGTDILASIMLCFEKLEGERRFINYL